MVMQNSTCALSLTVLNSAAMMGFGAHSSVLHTFKIERLSEDLSIVIEIIHHKEKIEDYLASL
jgi:PII-like signaling protein